MKFICCQPAIDYYIWQVDVMINNFIRNGISLEDIQIVCATYSGYSIKKWEDLATHYGMKFYFYPDTRPIRKYISSVRPFILHKHWIANPELESETVFYHDCDMIFTRPVDFKSLLEDDVCYVSDTISYIGAKYIRSKGEQYLNIMTKIVGIDKEKIIAEEANSGGAQYLIKNVNAQFWDKAYHDSERLFSVITAQIKKDNPPHAIQIWCADMWAVLWGLWNMNKEVKVTPHLDFAWATSSISTWEKLPIYHNAGALAERKDLFFKGKYQIQFPYNIKQEDFSEKWCSYKYVEEILKTKEGTCLK